VNVFWRLGPKWKSWEISKCWMEPTREVQNHHRSAMSIWFKTTDNVWSNYYGTLTKHINMIDSECFLLVAKFKKKWSPYFDGGKWPLYEQETCIAVQRFGAGFQGRRRLFRIPAFHVHEQIPSLSLGKMWVTNKINPHESGKTHALFRKRIIWLLLEKSTWHGMDTTTFHFKFWLWKKKWKIFNHNKWVPSHLSHRGATGHGMFQPSSPTASQRFLISPAWRYLKTDDIFGDKMQRRNPFFLRWFRMWNHWI
jgi:hypothetical protein